jgi:hypothetical protein
LGIIESIFPKTLAGRWKCAIFTGTLHSGGGFGLFIYENQFSEKPRRARLLAKIDFMAAPFPVRGLWMACTALKRRVLTKAYFSLTEKIEGVQQDRSLTAS